MNTITIRNKEYTVDQLESFITNDVVAEFVDYMKDPNCSADLWVSDNATNPSKLTAEERVGFIYLVNHKSNRLTDEQKINHLKSTVKSLLDIIGKGDVYNEEARQGYINGTYAILI